jgi:Flp pilus assembly pilin Flp
MKEFMKDTAGTSTVEYLVMAALAIAVAVLVGRPLLQSAANAGEAAKGQIDSQVQGFQP